MRGCNSICHRGHPTHHSLHPNVAASNSSYTYKSDSLLQTIAGTPYGTAYSNNEKGGVLQNTSFINFEINIIRLSGVDDDDSVDTKNTQLTPKTSEEYFVLLPQQSN